MKGQRHRLCWLLVLVAITLRVTVTLAVLRSLPQVSDARSYSLAAEELLSDQLPKKPFFWPPGVPIILSTGYFFVGKHLWVERSIAILISVLTVIAVALVARLLTRDSDLAPVALGLAAVYPASIMMSGQARAEHLTGLCLLIAVWCLLKATRTHKLVYFAGCGLALGWGALTRPSVLGLIGLCCVGLFAFGLRQRTELEERTRHQLLLGALVVLATSSTCVAPVLWHNARLGGGWTISTNNERNFFLGNNRYTPHYGTSHLAQRELQELEPEVQAYLSRFYNLSDSRSAMMKEAFEYIIQHPLVFLWRSANRIRAFWGFDYVMSRLIQRHYGLGDGALAGMLMLEAGGYLLVMVLFIAGLVCAWNSYDRAARNVILTTIVAYQFPYTISFASGLYHFPVIWLMMPFAAQAIRLLAKNGALSTFCKNNRRILIVVTVGLLMLQLEYAYHVAILR